MTLLDIVATRAHVRERLVRSLADPDLPRRGAALAPGTVAWPALVARLCLACLTELSVSPPAVDRLALAQVLRAELPSHDPAFSERVGTVDAFARALDTLRASCATPDDVLRAATLTEPDDDGTRERLRALARVYAAHDKRLAAVGLCAPAAVESSVAAAVDALREQNVSPRALGLPTELRVWHLASLPASRVALVTALSRWLAAHGGRVEAQVVCEPRRVRLPPGLDRALRDFEAETEGGLDLRYALRDPGAPEADEALSRWITTLAEGGRGAEHGVEPAPRPPVELAECHGPEEEARWVAARVERWIAEGVAPHEVAVVVPRCEPEVIEPLGRALDDARVPWSASAGAPLLSSPVARALLALPRTVARGAERDEVVRALSVLQGNAPRGGEPEPWRVGDALRRMGVDSLFDLALEERVRRASRPTQRRALSPALADAVVRLGRELWELSKDATPAEHAARLRRWVERVGGEARFVEETRATTGAAALDPGAHAVLRALARDEAGVAGAAELLREVPSLAEAVGRGGPMSAGEFAEMLLDLARDRPLYPRDAGASGGVEVLSADEAVGRCFAAVVMPGMWEGNTSRAHDDDALLGDTERAALSRALGRLVERARGREAETLTLLAAMATATRAFAASSTRHDQGGRARGPSPFFADLQRTSGVTVERVAIDPLARSRRVPPRGPERTLRAWARERRSEVDAPASLSALLRSTEQRAAVERARQQHFASPSSEGDAYNGRIDHDAALVASLELRRFGDGAEPVDTTTLERAARCAYKAFALRVLRIEEREEQRETLDAKQRGHLLHALLEAGQEALETTRGLAHDTRWAAVRGSLDEAGARFSLEVPRLDAGLLEADLRAIRVRVEAWIAGRMNAESDWRMVATEEAFGPGRRWPALEVPVDEGVPVVLHGRIDGVERVGDTLRVLEFKSGRGDGYRRRLMEGALDTQFQLVVYAAAVERARQAGALLVDDATGLSVDGYYVGFRDLGEHGLRDTLGEQRRKLPPMDVGALLSDAARGAGPLAEAVRRVVLPLREGRFAPRARDCQFCQYRSLCRVEAHEDLDDEPSGAGPSTAGAA
ncbi:MAG: PD-(D/E)XK nuclease family protein [Polyangiales bacterium]